MSTPPTPPVPEPPPPSGPPIKVTVTDVADQEIDYAQAAKLAAEGLKDSGQIERLVAALLAGLVKLVSPLLRLYFSNFDAVMAGVTEAFDAAEAEGTEGFSRLVAAQLGNLLGIEVDGGKLAEEFRQRGRIPAMREVGGSLTDLLTKEFVTDSQLTPEQGEAAAKAFLGFVMSFSVREGNTDVLAESIPEQLNILRGVKDYGEAMARNLGLGRLTRLALRPLVQTLLVTPYQWKLNKQYRPTVFSKDEIAKAFVSGGYTREQTLEEFARLGLSDEKASILLSQLFQRGSRADLRLLLLSGQIGEEQYQNEAKPADLPLSTWNLLRDADNLQERRTLSLSLANSLRGDVLNGLIDAGDYADALGRLMLSDAERVVFTTTLAELQSKPRKILTLAQMRQAFLDATITINEFESYLERVGYGEDDRHILVIDALLRAEKAAEAKERASARSKPKTPGPTTSGGSAAPPTSGT